LAVDLDHLDPCEVGLYFLDVGVLVVRLRPLPLLIDDVLDQKFILTRLIACKVCRYIDIPRLSFYVLVTLGFSHSVYSPACNYRIGGGIG
jgi:hypothetical protein